MQERIKHTYLAILMLTGLTVASIAIERPNPTNAQVYEPQTPTPTPTLIGDIPPLPNPCPTECPDSYLPFIANKHPYREIPAPWTVEPSRTPTSTPARTPTPTPAEVPTLQVYPGK